MQCDRIWGSKRFLLGVTLGDSTQCADLGDFFPRRFKHGGYQAGGGGFAIGPSNTDHGHFFGRMPIIFGCRKGCGPPRIRNLDLRHR